MDDPREPRPLHKQPERNADGTPNSVEHFEREFKFMEGLSYLIDLLERYEKPSRTSTQYELLGGTSDLRKMPEAISWIPGSENPDAIHITLVNEGGKPISTTIEIFVKSGTIYLSRSASNKADNVKEALASDDTSSQLMAELINDDDDDALIVGNGTSLSFPRVPNSQINDFLHSLTRRGEAPEKSRLLELNDGQEELVIGEAMADAIGDCAVGKITHYEYPVGKDRSINFGFDERMSGSRKLVTVSLQYKDWDMNRLAVRVDLDKGVHIGFRNLDGAVKVKESEDGLVQDYLIAQRVIREIKRSILFNPENAKTVSLQALTQYQIDKIASPEDVG